MRLSSLLAPCLLVSLLAACSDDAPAPGAGGQSGGGQGGSGLSGSSGQSGASQAGASPGGQAGQAGSSQGGASPGGQAGQGGSAGAVAGGAPSGGQAGQAGAGQGGSAEAGAAGQGAGGSAGATGGQAGAGGAAEQSETEPNGGASESEVNALTAGVGMVGAVGTAGDADVFKLEATPGKVYVARLSKAVGSQLQGHLAVFDAGRGGKAPGEDYVKIALAKGASDAVVELLAMGQGGYFLAVRDARNVDDPKAGLGGAGFGYRLTVEEHAASEFVQDKLPLPGTTSATFAGPGSLHLFSFTATADMTLTVDLKPGGSSLDGRFFVYGESTGDWVARNDDRSASDPSPLFESVPIQPAGAALLVVENVNPEANPLGYTLGSKTP